MYVYCISMPCINFQLFKQLKIHIQLLNPFFCFQLKRQANLTLAAYINDNLLPVLINCKKFPVIVRLQKWLWCLRYMQTDTRRFMVVCASPKTGGFQGLCKLQDWLEDSSFVIPQKVLKKFAILKQTMRLKVY